MSNEKHMRRHSPLDWLRAGQPQPGVTCYLSVATVGWLGGFAGNPGSMFGLRRKRFRGSYFA
jgi:hypothetical protein